MKTCKDENNFIAMHKQDNNSKIFGTDQVIKSLERKEEIMAIVKRKKTLRPRCVPSSITLDPLSLDEASSFKASSNQFLITKNEKLENENN